MKYAKIAHKNTQTRQKNEKINVHKAHKNEK